jgi:hypothetical protein
MSGTAVFFTLVVAMFPALLLVALVAKLREVSTWPETTGRMIASRIQSRKKDPEDADYGSSDTEVSNEPFVEYEYTVGRRKYRCSRITVGEKFAGTELEAVLDRYQVGKAVTVFYDPARPERALLERTLPMGMMVKGGGCLLACFVGGPLIAASLYFNALGWLRARSAHPGQERLARSSSGENQEYLY